MQLKKITLAGFKSFADKTTFDFGPGVTIVVGPNGCGKSNIVDAVKWVLGEQSAKSLRGGHMLDVIFNGTTARKSMGMAEVALTFTNENRLLHVDLDEVCVTRQLYRSGESKYLLNDKPCRLKDIREMFLDTGVGADAYSIIEQGKVAVLLQTSADERRAIFEEASGISRYKTRKKEALRKLERTEQNVLRLQDVIGELEKRLRSIRYQAGKARSYQEYAMRLKELRLKQFLAEFHQLQEEAGRVREHLIAAQDELIALTTESERVQTRLSVLDHEIDQLDRTIHTVESELLQCTSQISNQQDRIEFGHRRCGELQEVIARSRTQMRQISQQIVQWEQTLAADQQEVDNAQQLLDQQQQQLDELQQTRQTRALELTEHRADLEDEKSGLFDIVRRTAQIHNQINSLDMRRDNLTGQKDRLNTRSGQISSELTALLTERAQLDAKLETVRTLIAESQAQLELKRQQLAQLNQEQLHCSENLAAAKETRSGLQSRRQLLADMEAKLEGVDQGVKRILQAKHENPDTYFYVKAMVAELIRAEVQYAAIIEAALSDKSQQLVVTDSAALMADLDNLQELPGRVQMICLDRLPAFADGFDFTTLAGFHARALDLVSFPADAEKLAWQLLGKTVIADDLAAALNLAQHAPQGYRFVTLNGEVLEPDGTVHLGPQTGKANLISRKSELRQLETAIADSDERIRVLQNQLEQFVTQAGHLERNLQELRTAIYENNTEKIEAQSRRDQLEHNVNRLTQEQPLIANEIEALEQQIDEALHLQEENRQSLVDLESVNQQRKAHIAVLEETIRTLEAEDQVVLNQITEVKVALGQAQQRRLALREKITNTQTQIRQQQHSLESMKSEQQNAEINLHSAERGILSAESKISELFHSRQQQQSDSQKLRAQREELLEEKERLGEQAKQLNQTRQTAQDNLHAAQMKLNENNLRQENLRTRAQEEVSLDLARHYQRIIEAQQRLAMGEAAPCAAAEADTTAAEETPAVAAPQADAASGEVAGAPAAQLVQGTPEPSGGALVTPAVPASAPVDETLPMEIPLDIDWDAVREEIEDLRRKIQRLGNVNLDAISEQDELEQRAGYLNTQLADLVESQKQLAELIAKINQESEQRFRENFEAIRENFAELFRKLFGGGKADIILQDPDNILECGIDIVARPPGKQLQSISLLSGGEKTMAAVALLMGIFKSKPSPFCLLDEVDAALDEANIERFNLVVKEFLEKSQFVIITHSRRTMAIADVIYGVTMQEQGVSKKVSVKFNENETGDIAVA